jgi:hypothetical protein
MAEMTAEELRIEKERALRRLESAAASAINNGADPDEVDAVVRIGVDQAMKNPYNIMMREKAAARR